MRLINAGDAYIVLVDEYHLRSVAQSYALMEALDKVPTVDAEPVIRCKDCKFATITDGVYSRNPEVKYCDIWFPNEAEYMPINYYCASAERKGKCD